MPSAKLSAGVERLLSGAHSTMLCQGWLRPATAEDGPKRPVETVTASGTSVVFGSTRRQN